MLPLPEGQTGEAWEPSKNNALPKIGERLIEKYFHLVFKGLIAVHLQDQSIEHTNKICA